ncbi:MAG: tyrosine-type recombinase/integrase [Opitutaceae bacterium]|nr:tyrosine-type recombinase/integrase [Opitutaceae bacterium]
MPTPPTPPPPPPPPAPPTPPSPANPAKPRVSKSHPDYWASRLYHESGNHADGTRHAVPEYSVRIHYKGRRERFALHTANKALAAAKARDIHASLCAAGWQPTLAKYKPPMTQKTLFPTIGEYLRAARAVSNIAPGTFNIYAAKLRTLVAGVLGITPRKITKPVINPATGLPQRNRKTGEPRTRLVDPRFDVHGDKGSQWRDKLDAIRLDAITPEKVQKWLVSRLSEHTASPAKLASTRITLNSHVRNAASLFTPRIIRHLSGTIALPNPPPFDGVEKPSAPVRRYESRISPQILNAKAELELRDAQGDTPDAQARRECYTIYLLALFCGLRRDEIDTLAWNQVDLARGLVYIETNEFTTAKTATSEQSVRIAPDITAHLKAKFARRTGLFVIESPVAPKPEAATYHHYRCTRLFKRLVAWLRANGGVQARNPLHTLRKEFGSHIARHHGIQAASEALRHGDIRLTFNYYVSPVEKPTFSPAMLSMQPSPPAPLGNPESPANGLSLRFQAPSRPWE